MPDLDSLLNLFYANPTRCGIFTQVMGDELPAPYTGLLNHDDHMTVTMEAFHDSLVDVEVLDSRRDAEHYARKILLRRQTDQAVVQFGIVQLHLRFLADDVRAEIESCQTPLGRVLIKHNVMRRVELVSLWQVIPGDDLCGLLGSDRTTYGRTALIHVNEEPAVELLEIVTPTSV